MAEVRKYEFSMAKKFALQNLKANKLLEIPFVLSSGVMLILFNITASLVNNNYVKTRHVVLPTLINFWNNYSGNIYIYICTVRSNLLVKKEK